MVAFAAQVSKASTPDVDKNKTDAAGAQASKATTATSLDALPSTSREGEQQSLSDKAAKVEMREVQTDKGALRSFCLAFARGQSPGDRFGTKKVPVADGTQGPEKSDTVTAVPKPDTATAQAKGRNLDDDTGSVTPK
jgi:hypothetical protein